MTVGIPRQLLESALDALTGVARTEPLRFDLRVDLLGGGGAAARRLLDFIVREADLGTSPGQWPIVEDRLVEAFACMLLSGVPHNHSHLFAVAPTAKEPRYVRRVEEYIETNAHRHIALADLAATAGVPVRTLTAAFRAHRGCSPIAFLRSWRFDLARKRLLAMPRTTVAEVAMSCGFEHLGRFGVGYQQRFGERASETLRRSHRLHASRPG